MLTTLETIDESLEPSNMEEAMGEESHEMAQRPNDVESAQRCSPAP